MQDPCDNMLYDNCETISWSLFDNLVTVVCETYPNDLKCVF